MSGGYFDYAQFRIGEITTSIEDLIEREEHPGDNKYTNGFNETTLGEFRNAVLFLKLAEIYAQRIDWLVSGDDGETTFHRRLKEDLEREGLLKK